MSNLKQSYLCCLSLFIVLFLGISCGEKQSVKSKKESELSPRQFFTIKGNVTLEDSNDHSEIQVFASGTSLIALTERNGKYKIFSVPPGDYTINAQKQGYLSEKIATINVSKAISNDEGVILLPTINLTKEEKPAPETALGGLYGIVDLEDEDTFSGVIVKIRGSKFSVTTDENGVYRFLNLASGDYTLSFYKPGFKRREIDVTVPAGDLQPMPSIKLARIVDRTIPRKITGKIKLLSLRGEPVDDFSNITVRLDKFPHITSLDLEGRFTFSALEPKVYKIVVTKKNYKMRSPLSVDLRYVAEAKITVLMDQITEEKKTGSIVGRVILEDEKKDFSGITVGLAGTSYVALTDTDGNFRIENVEKGRYAIIAKSEGYLPIRMEYIEIESEQEAKAEQIVLPKSVVLPEVIFTDPANKQINVTLKERVPVFIRFNKKMRPDSVKRAIIIIPQVDYEFFMGKAHPQSDFDLALINLKADSEKKPVNFDTRYTITVGKSAADFDNLKLAEPYTFNFRTGKASIINTYPSDGASNISPLRSFITRIYFNTTIDVNTFDEKNISVYPRAAGLYFYTKEQDGWSTGYISMVLEENKRYIVTIKKGVRTSKGSTLSNTPYKFAFQTSKIQRKE